MELIIRIVAIKYPQREPVAAAVPEVKLLSIVVETFPVCCLFVAELKKVHIEVKEETAAPPQPAGSEEEEDEEEDEEDEEEDEDEEEESDEEGEKEATAASQTKRRPAKESEEDSSESEDDDSMTKDERVYDRAKRRIEVRETREE